MVKKCNTYSRKATGLFFSQTRCNNDYWQADLSFGYLTESQKQTLQRVLNRANRRGFTPYYHDLDTLAESAQHDRFRHSHHCAHCLNHLYATKRHRVP